VEVMSGHSEIESSHKHYLTRYCLVSGCYYESCTQSLECMIIILLLTSLSTHGKVSGVDLVDDLEVAGQD